MEVEFPRSQDLNSSVTPHGFFGKREVFPAGHAVQRVGFLGMWRWLGVLSVQKHRNQRATHKNHGLSHFSLALFENWMNDLFALILLII